MSTNSRYTKQLCGVMGIIAATLILAACIFTSSVQAEDAPMSDQRRDSIIQNCSTIKLRLKQLQTNDASMRVVLGQNYENILTRLMDAMNSRLTSNRLDSGELPTIAAEFDRNLGYFRKNYINYDQKVDELRKYNCTGDPEGFYKQLETLRNLRGALRLNYSRLNELISHYREELGKVLKGEGSDSVEQDQTNS